MYYSDNMMYQKIMEANRSLNGGVLKGYQDATANDIQRLADKVIEDCGDIPLYVKWEITYYVVNHCATSIDVTEEFTRGYGHIEGLESVYKLTKFIVQEDGYIVGAVLYRCYLTDGSFVNVGSRKQFREMIKN